MTGRNLAGKAAIVTGAARGFGKAIALTLSQRGAAVVVSDIRSELAEAVVEEIKSAEGEAIALSADISNEQDVKSMVAETLKRFGTVDILVNNAGIMSTISPMVSISLEDFQKMIEVNLTGTFLCMKAVLPIYKAKNSGKIVNLSSSAGRSMSTFNGAHYTASKAGILGLTRHAANEAAPFNININAVTPGSFVTEGGLELLPGLTPEMTEQIEQAIPIRRLGDPQDLANLVAFLCSEEASYITGATIDINGGDLMM
jgi:NAD(P)-dependent dehydrogenase (short-subunit alcohol dehydrogenase family)